VGYGLSFLVIFVVNCSNRFMTYLSDQCNCSVRCNIFALIYMSRLITINDLRLTQHNWRIIWLTCMIISVRIWEIKPIETAAFSRIFPSIHQKTLRSLKLQALTMLQFVTNITPKLYNRYCSELVLLSEQLESTHSLSTCSPLPTAKFPLCPLASGLSDCCAPQPRNDHKEALNKGEHQA
jgi:hypothetical protein